jgi:hypothetical protein
MEGKGFKGIVKSKWGDFRGIGDALVSGRLKTRRENLRNAEDAENCGKAQRKSAFLTGRTWNVVGVEFPPSRTYALGWVPSG